MLEPQLITDPRRDFCLWGYTARATNNPQYRMSNLLWLALEEMNAPKDWRAMLERLRDEIGVGETVFGIKKTENEISIELYFYDYQRLQRTKTAERVLSILEPFLKCDLPQRHGTPWFMFSLDLDANAMKNRSIEALDFYFGSPGAGLSSGISYRQTSEEYALRNIYNFFSAKREGALIYRKLNESGRADLSVFSPRDLAFEEFQDADMVVVANKRSCDGLYFTRLDVLALSHFFAKYAYPSSFETLVRSGGFESHRFDIGIDFECDAKGISYPKTAFYGIL